MQALLFACRKCAGPLDPGAKRAFAGHANILFDLACGECGHRALYGPGA